jgi:pimeloyl-ACP methyl ester carboxylesterase
VATLRSTEVAVDDIGSPMLEAGDADANEAVVFVHGSPGSSSEFSELVQRTGEFARAIAIDSPGFGQADKPSPHTFEYSSSNLGIHLARQLEVLGVERAHFVGHDFGGAFSIFAGLYSPTKVGSMTMLSSGVMRGYRWHKIARVYRTPVLGEAFMEIANKQGFKRTLLELPDDELEVMWRNFDRATRKAVLALYRATDQKNQSALIPQLRLVASQWPGLVIFGQDDRYLPSALAARNTEWLTQADVKLIPHSGHWPHLETPDQVAKLLLPFLQQRLTVASSA